MPAIAMMSKLRLSVLLTTIAVITKSVGHVAINFSFTELSFGEPR